jgi:hypothetical protein
MAAFRRAGLHKLECDCGAYVYATVAMLERHGLPACPCGARFMPDRVELAELLGVDCPAVAEYHAELSSVMHGQASHGLRGRKLRPAELVAFERVEQRRRERALTNRLAALMPAVDVEALPF